MYIRTTERRANKNTKQPQRSCLPLSDHNASWRATRSCAGGTEPTATLFSFLFKNELMGSIDFTSFGLCTRVLFLKCEKELSVSARRKKHSVLLPSA